MNHLQHYLVSGAVCFVLITALLILMTYLEQTLDPDNKPRRDRGPSAEPPS